MAWRSGPSVVFATLSGSGKRSSSRSLRIPLLNDLGPILYVGAEARLFATAAIDRPFSKAHTNCFNEGIELLELSQRALERYHECESVEKRRILNLLL